MRVIQPPSWYTRYPHGHICRYACAGCRCAVCLEGGRRWRSKQGHARRISGARARRHMSELRRHGVGRDAIAAVTGINATTLQKIKQGAQTTAATEARILGVGLGARCDGGNMGSKRARWRLLKMREEFESWTQLAVFVGLNAATLRNIVARRLPGVRARTDVRIARAYALTFKVLGAKAAPAAPAPRVQREERVRLTPERRGPLGRVHPWRIAAAIGVAEAAARRDRSHHA